MKSRSLPRPNGLSFFVALFWLGGTALPALANWPGGTNGSSVPVTLTNSGGNATMANGIVSIVCQTSAAQINQINYTYNNSGQTTTTQLLNGGYDGGKFYWETGGFSSGTFTYTPVAAGPQYGEMDCVSTSTANGTLDIHFSMLQGSPGFYVTAIWSHRSVDAAMSMGETRDNIYAGSMFNWMCVDSRRNKLMEVSGGSAIGVYGAPVEVSIWTNGLYAGQYEDKYKYSADFGAQRVWGWASVNAATGSGGINVGLWNVLASVEYYNGGPMKRELMSHIGTTILNMTHGGHYGGGQDGHWAAGEVWTQVCGPWFIYCNNVTNSLTNPAQAAAALYADAQAQADAEATAWPYSWLTNANYAPASKRGAVSGQIVIKDTYNTNASAAGLWVGLIQQPSTTDGIYDFQDWCKCYQFWVKSGPDGAFTVSNVIAGANYTLYAFGPGAAGMFMSQNQTGGNPDLTFNLPASPFSVTVTGGATNNLGAVTWTPTRVGPTVFEIGYPNRTAEYKFRHSDDWWVGDIGPSSNAPSPIWSKYFEYPFDFPNGPSYVVGQSRWSTDWNFCQPAVFDSSGGGNSSSSTITFNLASAPAGGANGSFYMATASDFTGPIVVSVNGHNLGSTSGTTSTPNANGSGGYSPDFSGGNQQSDTTIREGIHGCYSDERITFPGSLLVSGPNTITIKMNGGGAEDHIMYDYIRLELSGYVPPPPAAVTAYPGNNCNLLSWPVTPGATSYNILRSTNSGGGYASIAANVAGPVCGSGSNNATYLDTNALNGTAFYYVVQSVNPVGASAGSPASAATTPSAAITASAPSAPTGLAVTVAHTNVTLTWNPSSGANYYSVWRSTLADTGGGASNILSTNILDNTITTATYTDTRLTDGAYYSYFVTAANAGGTSPNSAWISATPRPAPPAGAPGNFTVTATTGSSNQQATLSWSAVSGAVGYIIERSTSSTGPFTFGGNFVASLTETAYTDNALSLGTNYYYVVAAVNAGGVSPNSAIMGTASGPSAPSSLNAIAGNAQVTLIWSAVAGAASYVIKSGASSGNETTTVASGVTGESFTNTGLINGTTYYYVVAATENGSNGPPSPEASATPSATISMSTWIWTGAAGAAWDTTTANWANGGNVAVYADGDPVAFNDSAATTAVAVTSAVYPASVTFSNATATYTLSAGGAGLSGPAGIVKTNSGEVILAGANAFTGGTVINGGMIALPGANGSAAFTAALGSGPVTLNSGGELQLAPPGGSAGKTSSTFSNDFVLNGGTLYANDGQEHLAGSIAVSAASSLLRQWDNSTADQTKALLLDGVLSGSAALNLSGTGGYASQGARIWIDNPANTYSGTITVNASTALGGFALALGANNALEYATVNLQGVRPAASTDATVLYGVEFLAGQDAPALGGLAGNGNIALADLAGAAVVLTIGGNNASTAFSGVLSGAGALSKTGGGTLTLSGANTYTGATTVNAGQLLVNGSLAPGSAVLVATGGMLGGAGTINGPVTVQGGGVFSPGGSLGRMNFGSSVSLAAGSTNLFQISPSPLTNNSAGITGALTNGGVLLVSNVTASAPAANQTFALFNAASFHGAFATVILPPLPLGLGWNTNQLDTGGVIAVVITARPVIQPPVLSAAGLVFSGSGGVAYGPYSLLSSSNLAAPLSNWSALAGSYFDGGGNFVLTNPPNPAWPQQFYKLEPP